MFKARSAAQSVGGDGKPMEAADAHADCAASKGANPRSLPGARHPSRVEGMIEPARFSNPRAMLQLLTRGEPTS
jgi:hypothetical protein